ncbi:MAG: lysophospholipid acyltransferase family protein [Planctomycetaceae bacterium]
MRRFLEYLGYRVLARIVPLLPRRASVWLGRRLGGLYCILDPRGRRTAKSNLRLALPDRVDHASIYRESMRLQGVALLDALWSRRLTPARAARYVTIAPGDAALVGALLREGRGLVIATAHLGSWEMFNVAAGALGFPRTTFIAREVRNTLIDRHLRRARERTGNELVYREEAILKCASALRRGEIVSSVIDMAVVAAEGALFTDFFGTPATTSGALPALAVRLRAPLLFAVCRHLDKGRRYVIEGHPIPVREGGDREAETVRLTRALNEALEATVRAHPEAWIWGYKRWKYRPSEDPGAYPDYALWLHPRW